MAKNNSPKPILDGPSDKEYELKVLRKLKELRILADADLLESIDSMIVRQQQRVDSVA